MKTLQIKIKFNTKTSTPWSVFALVIVLFLLPIGPVHGKVMQMSNQVRDELGLLRFAKFDSQGANGKCIDTIEPTDFDKIRDVQKKYGLKIKGNPRKTKAGSEAHAFAEVIQTIGQLGDGRFRKHLGFTASYEKEKRLPQGKVISYSTCSNSTLILRRNWGQNIKHLSASRRTCGHGRNNSIHIAHEMGHCMGNKKINGQRIYDAYNAAVPSPCWPTQYASLYYDLGRKRNEEFGEAFGAYLMNPDLLQKNPSCQKAIAFFANLIGESRPVEEITCLNRAKALRGLATTPPPITPLQEKTLPRPRQRPVKKKEMKKVAPAPEKPPLKTKVNAVNPSSFKGEVLEWEETVSPRSSQ